MASVEPTGRRPDAWVALGCLLAAAAVFWLFRDLRHDDAFITFRYARNLLAGDGFTFNPGERVLGTTTPLFALLSALLLAVFGTGGLPTAAVGLNCLALAAQAFVLYRLLRDELPWTAVAVAACTVLGAFGSHNKLALETNTFAALLLTAVWGLAQRRPWLCGLGLGLAFLTRYDAALLVPLVPLFWRRGGWRRPAAALGTAAIPVLPWLLFATPYFGSPLPHTLGAKAGITPFVDYLAFYADHFLRLPGVAPDPVSRAVALALAGLGVVHVVRHARALVPLLLFALGQWLVYAAIGPSAVQTWHMYVPQLAVTLLVLLGAFASLERLGTQASLASLARWRPHLFAGLAIAWCLLLGAETLRAAASFPRDIWLGVRHARYTAVAEWVGEHVRPRQTFLSIEVGTLGYLTDHRMVDPYGLVTPSNDYPRTRSFDDLTALVAREEPDLVLLDSPFEGVELERRLPYRTVRMFPWVTPWSTLLVRRPDVLRDPEELPELRRRLPRRVGRPEASRERR